MKCLIVAILVSCVPVVGGRCQKSAARFLLWRPSAVSNAMGGVGTSLYGDAFGAYHNPASLAFVTGLSAAGSFVRPMPYFSPIGHSFFALAVPFHDFGTLAASVNLIWQGAQSVTDEFGNTVGENRGHTQWHGHLSYGTEIAANLSGGLSLGYFEYDLSGYDATGQGQEASSGAVTIDVGLMYRNLFPSLTRQIDASMDPNSVLGRIAARDQDPGITLGIELQNFGGTVSMIDDRQADPLPTSLVTGASCTVLRSLALSALIAAELEANLPENHPLEYLHAGFELRVMKILALRAGRFIDLVGPRNSYATWGFGFVTKFGSVNFARYQRSYAPVWHVDGTVCVPFSVGESL